MEAVTAVDQDGDSRTDSYRAAILAERNLHWPFEKPER